MWNDRYSGNFSKNKSVGRHHFISPSLNRQTCVCLCKHSPPILLEPPAPPQHSPAAPPHTAPPTTQQASPKCSSCGTTSCKQPGKGPRDSPWGRGGKPPHTSIPTVPAAKPFSWPPRESALHLVHCSYSRQDWAETSSLAAHPFHYRKPLRGPHRESVLPSGVPTAKAE